MWGGNCSSGIESRVSTRLQNFVGGVVMWVLLLGKCSSRIESMGSTIIQNVVGVLPCVATWVLCLGECSSRIENAGSTILLNVEWVCCLMGFVAWGMPRVKYSRGLRRGCHHIVSANGEEEHP